MASISAAVNYPMERDDWIKTILIGGALTLFGFLIVPVLLVSGYLVRVIRARLDEDPEPPAFGDWGDLLVDGLKWFVIGLVYMIVPMIVWGVTVGGSILSIASGTEAGAAGGIAGLLVGSAISFVLFLAFGYVAVAGLVNFVRHDELSAAFDVATIKQVVTDRDFAVAWLAVVGIFIVVGILNAVLGIVPILGSIVGIFVSFYFQIAAAYLWSEGYAAAVDGVSPPDSATAEESAI